MSKIITINVAEMAVGRSDTHIRTSSIGSCVVIVLYDPIARVGGMAHSMLPSRRRIMGGEAQRANAGDRVSGSAEAPAKYVNQAIDLLLKEVEEIGGKKERIEAKLIGGAKMFQFLEEESSGIGNQNIKESKKRLAELGIPVKGGDTGGNMGRVADVNCENGLVEIITKI